MGSGSMPQREVDLAAARRALQAFLRAVGAPVDEDPELQRTAETAARAFAEELLEGYRMDPAEVLARCTRSEARSAVVLRALPTTVVCPHHLLPAVGVVHVGYLPGGRVAGFGAISKLVRCYARRLVLQEELVRQVAEALVEHLGARGAGCVAVLQPTCLTARGPCAHGAKAVTSWFAGPEGDDPVLRAGLLNGPTGS